MSDDQAAAIHLYTQESLVYKKFNSALRERNRAALVPFFPYLHLLLSAFHHLVPETMTVYRGVKADLREIYKKGK